jgi:plasmid stabilization system protein ParE
MPRYVLTTNAQHDLVSIYDYYLDHASPRITRQLLTEFVQAFRFLARNPGAGHTRDDLAETRPILFWPVRDFVILYQRETKPLQILGVVHGSQDVPRILGQRRH